MKLKVKVYCEMNSIIENEEYLAIKIDNVIKYIDFANNKMIVNIGNEIITRENNDYLFTIDFKENNIIINVKHLKKEFNKKIETMKMEKNSNSFLVRYKLIDDDVINEYYIRY